MEVPTTLTHLAIIPDGNRRWAKQHGQSSELVYSQSGEKLIDLLKAAFDMGVRYLSLWIGSYDNLHGRDKLEISVLKKLYKQKFEELAEHPYIMDNKIKIEAIGEWRDLLSVSGVKAVQHALDVTAHHTNGTLAIFMGYDGRRERGAALRALAEAHQEVPHDPAQADHMLRSFAWSGHLPDVDLLIRTGAWEDPHNSGHFLTFLNGDTQFAFPRVLWPDFSIEMLRATIQDFATRERRLGK